MRSCKLS